MKKRHKHDKIIAPLLPIFFNCEQRRIVICEQLKMLQLFILD